MGAQEGRRGLVPLKGVFRRRTRNGAPPYVTDGWAGMSALQETKEQILVGIRYRWRSDAERRRVAEPIRLIDGLLADLEELHLTDRKRVPPSYEARLIQLAAVLAPEVRQELRCRVTIVHLMGRLYEIQGRLLARKATDRGDDGDDLDGGRNHGAHPPARAAEPAA